MIIVFFAVVMLAALTAAIQGSNKSETANIDRERLYIRATEIERYASEIERAVLFIINNGYSEADIRFAHPNSHADYGDLSADSDPTNQVFHPSGGGALYRAPPSGINDGSPWEFYGGTALPAVGSGAAELVMVLPNVSDEFCAIVNYVMSQPGTPLDTGGGSASGSSPGDCVYQGDDGRFSDSQQFYNNPNTMDITTFLIDPNLMQVRPAPQACVTCSVDGNNHFYTSVLSR